MNWFEKMLAQMSRIFGGESFTEEMSEAEAVTALEKITPISEMQNANAKAIEEVQAVVAKANETITALQETIATQSEQIKQLTESQAQNDNGVSTLIKDLQKEIQTLREESGREFNALKGVRENAEQKPPIAPPVKEDGKKGGDKVIAGNFLDTHLKTVTVGLN